MDTVYVESAVADHPRTAAILSRYPRAHHVPVERYGEVFNAPGQNFRRQKRQPALILAAKHGQRVLPAPADYHIGGKHNYYFSHMLNCVYDCRYCFLQGMYQSANYVVFVNFEDFFDDIQASSARHTAPSWYFSGYDCDSLALEPLTGFVDATLDRFAKLSRAWLELRTKSTQIRSLLARPPIDNCVIAYSLSPAAIARAEEHGTASLARRLDALLRLQQHGWRIGLRFDPILAASNFEALYDELFIDVFDTLDARSLHSVSLGPFRLPKSFHRRMVKLYPDAQVLAPDLELRQGLVSYPAQAEQDMLGFCQSRLLEHIEPTQYFPCVSIGNAAGRGTRA